jgi:acetyl esterase/lipase
MPSWQCHVVSLFLRVRVKRRPPATEEKLAKLARSVMDNPRLQPKLSKDVEVRQVAENGLKGEWVNYPNADERKTILYFHGGGYIAGSPLTYRFFASHLSRATRARVFLHDYRLAPEHRFPAALDDGVIAYLWLLEKGVSPEQIVFAGDSAGGGLLMATMLALKKLDHPLPRASVCISPWADLACSGQSYRKNKYRDSMLHGDGLKKAAQVYLGHASPHNPLASPLYGDFEGFPPMLIYASESEVLLDDSVRLAKRMKENGVSVDLQTRDGMPHVWPVIVGLLPEAKESLVQMSDFIKRNLESEKKLSAAI